jgi:hypothetical protein
MTTAQAPAPPFDTRTLIEICQRNDVTMVGLVGSMARGETHDQSDIDLVVRFAKPRSLVGVIALEQQLEAALGRDVDLLTEAALSPYLRDRMLRDLQVLCEA